MGYFQVRYDSSVVNYNRRGFIRLATGTSKSQTCVMLQHIWYILLGGDRVVINTTAYIPLRPIQPSSPSTKELHLSLPSISIMATK